MFNFLFGKKKKAKEEKPVERPDANEEIPKDYKFMLQAYNRGNDLLFFDPTEDEIKKALATLADTHENFVILEAAQKVKTFTFLQATDYDMSMGTVYLEAQYEGADGVLHSYGRVIKSGALSGIFRAFISGEVPDITGWEHIADF